MICLDGQISVCFRSYDADTGLLTSLKVADVPQCSAGAISWHHILEPRFEGMKYMILNSNLEC